MLPDSVKTDSTAAQIPAIALRLFVEEDTIQSFSKMQNKEFGKYEFFYKNNITTVAAEAIRGTLPDRWEVIGSDTITWYCKEEVKDTVLFVMTVNGTACDTLELTPFKKREARGRRADKQDGGKLLITSSNTGELYKPLTLSFSYPIRPTENAQVQLIGKRKRAGNDTINIPVTVKDTFARSISIPTKLEEKVPYTLIITDSTFQGYNNLYNDSTVVNFTNRSAKDYGSIRMTFNLPTTSDFIVQLLNDKDRVLREDVLRGESELLYSNLLAGRYKLKVIEDRNGNGRWDTGKYNEKRQPERVAFFSKTLTVRGYWELEETFAWPE